MTGEELKNNPEHGTEIDISSGDPKVEVFKMESRFNPINPQTAFILLILLVNLSISQIDGWSDLYPMNRKRVYHAAVKIDPNTIIVSGGSNEEGSTLKSAEILDKITGKWTEIAPMLFPRYNHKLVRLNENEVLAIAGGNTKSCELYNLQTNSWQLVDSLSDLRSVGWTATQFSSGEILVAGGLNFFPIEGDSKWIRSCELFNPYNYTWHKVDSLPSGRYNHTTTLINNVEALVLGGTNPNKKNESFIFNLDSLNFTEIDTPKHYRSGHNALKLSSGDVFISGGLSSIPGLLVHETELFDTEIRNYHTAFSHENIYLHIHSVFELKNQQLLICGSVYEPSSWYLINYPNGEIAEHGYEDTLYQESVYVQVNDEEVIGVGGMILRVGGPGDPVVLEPTANTRLFSQNITNIIINDNFQNQTERLSVSNHPNPFNSSTVISFKLKLTTEVEIVLYSSTGQKLTTILKAKLPPGEYKKSFDATNLASGMYFYKVSTSYSISTGKMTIIK
jgi:hypothetical protein